MERARQAMHRLPGPARSSTARRAERFPSTQPSIGLRFRFCFGRLLRLGLAGPFRLGVGLFLLRFSPLRIRTSRRTPRTSVPRGRAGSTVRAPVPGGWAGSMVRASVPGGRAGSTVRASVPGGWAGRTASVRAHRRTSLGMTTHHVRTQPTHAFGELLKAQLTAVVAVHAGEHGFQVGHRGPTRTRARPTRRAGLPGRTSLRLGLSAFARTALGNRFLPALGKLLAYRIDGRLELLASDLPVLVGVGFGQHLFQRLGQSVGQLVEYNHSCVLGVEPLEQPHRVELPLRRSGAPTAFRRALGPSRCGGAGNHTAGQRPENHPLHHASP